MTYFQATNKMLCHLLWLLGNCLTQKRLYCSAHRDEELTVISAVIVLSELRRQHCETICTDNHSLVSLLYESSCVASESLGAV